MKTLLSLIKFTFFTTPLNAAQWAEQNEKRMTAIISFIIFIGTVAVLMTALSKGF